MRHSKEVQSKSYNSHSRPSPVYAPNDLVWLSRRYIPSTRPSNKLDYRRIGPFRVSRMIGRNLVRLHLGPGYSRLHPVFNVSLVSPYVDPSLIGRPPSLAPPLASATSPPVRDWLQVSAILDFRTRGRHRAEYLLRWVNGSPSDDSWIPLTDISCALDPYLWEFHRRYPTLPVPKALSALSRDHQGFQASLHPV